VAAEEEEEEEEPQTPVLVQLRAPVRLDASPLEAEAEAAEVEVEVEPVRDALITNPITSCSEYTYRKLLLGLWVRSSTGSTNRGTSHDCGCAPPTRGRRRDGARDRRGCRWAAGRLLLRGTLLCQRLTLAPR
jgi:hypothetical protein